MRTIKTTTKIGLARVAQRAVMAWRALLGKGAEAVVTRRGVRWALDLREGIDFSIWLLGSFEPGTVAAYLRQLVPGDTVIDVGANIGAHTLHFARAVGDSGRVVAFEPTDFAFAKLRRNIELNPHFAPRIVAVQGMLRASGSGHAAEPVYSSWPLSRETDVHPMHLGRLMSCAGASAGSLDSYVERLGLARLDLIKIDVDGFECEVLDGAVDTLRRFRPRLIMEICPYALDERQAGNVERLCDLISRAGYVLKDMDSGASLPLDAARIRGMIPPGASLNVIGVPSP